MRSHCSSLVWCFVTKWLPHADHHILWGFSGSFGGFPIWLIQFMHHLCTTYGLSTIFKYKISNREFPVHWVLCRKDHFSFYTTGEEQQKKFQGIARTSYPMVLYLQKTRVVLKIQFSAVKQWESNLQRSGSHLELLHMGWKQSVSDSLCHSLQRMAESAVEKNPEKEVIPKRNFVPWFTFSLPQCSLYFRTETQSSHFPSEDKINQEFLHHTWQRLWAPEVAHLPFSLP